MITKERLLDIFLTACIGAAIAFLQGLLAGLIDPGLPHATPEMAGVAAGFTKLIFPKIVKG